MEAFQWSSSFFHKPYKYIREGVLTADYMNRAGSVEGLALSAEMTVQPGITWGGPARLRLNLEAVVWKYGYIEEHDASVFILANPLFWRISFGFT